MTNGLSQDKITAYWNAHAEAYDQNQTERQSRHGAREVWTDVWRHALPSPPADVLDVGTGSGNVATLLAELGYRVTAIDLADGMLEQARHKSLRMPTPPRWARGDAVTPLFPEAAFDAITARYLLWTLREPEVALANWRRLLRPGGVLVVVDSLWYPEGVSVAHDGPDATQRDRDFRGAYDDAAVRALPVAESTDISAMAALLKSAEFTDVRVEELPDVLDLDRRYGVAPGHRAQMQYRISGRRVPRGSAEQASPM